MANRENQYYSNSQIHYNQGQGQEYSQNYWYGQSANVPTTAAQSHATSTSTHSNRNDYGYSNNTNNNNNSAAYTNRSHYDTSALSTLPPINSALNDELTRPAQRLTQGFGYGASPAQVEQQATHHQPSYANASQRTYTEQQARRLQGGNFALNQTGYAVPRPTSASLSQLHHTFSQPQRSTSPQTTSGGPISEHIARAAESVSNRTSVPRSSNGSIAQSDQPALITVDPQHVYNPHLEYQRQLKRVEEQREAEKKRAKEVAEEEASNKEEQRSEQIADVTDIRTTSAEEVQVVPTKKKRSRQRKSEGMAADGAPRVPKSRKSRKSAPAGIEVDEPAQAAALTLMTTANASSAISLEEQMRDMFKKMREFQNQDPTMLARMWQQERDEFLAKDHPAKETTNETPVVAPAPAMATPNKVTSKAPAASSQAPTKSLPAPTLPPVKTTTPKQLTAPGTTISTSSRMGPQRESNTIPGPTTSAKTAGTTWPADKKQVLAATAAKLLLAMPANAGKVISPSQIAAILDTNPSYIELCLKFESMGFKVDRGPFARALLQAVPDVNKAAQKPIQSTEGTTHGIITTSTSTDTLGNSSSASVVALNNAANRLLNGGAVIETDTTMKPKAKTPRTSKINHSSRMASVPNAADSVSIPLDESALDPQLEGLDAVKRFIDGSWQEISHQTNISPSTGKQKGPRKSYSRPSLPPPPITKEAVARKRAFGDLVDLTALDSDNEPLPFFSDRKRHESEYPSTPTQLLTPPQTETEIIPNMSLHDLPQQRVAVTQPRAAPPPSSDHPSRTTPMVQQVDKYKAIRRSTYNPKTIARDVLLACGRHPDMRHLNAHLEALKTSFPQIDNSADLGTFRWDIADPGGPAPGSGSGAGLPLGFGIIDAYDDADDEESENELSERTAVRATVVPDHAIETDMAILPRPRKIFPQSRQSQPAVRSHVTPGSQIRPGSTNTPESSATGKFSSYKELRAAQGQTLDETGQPVKKKGRPVGWRKWMQKDPSGASSGSGGIGSSKTAKLGKGQEPKPPELIFQLYKCEWQECGAELHNLATLRKHVFKLHAKQGTNKLYPCLWKDCGKVRSVNNGARTVSRFVVEEFEAEHPWQDHIEKRHVQPIAWELGDGPPGGLSERESDLSEAYLSDSHGRRITPIVTPAKPSNDANSQTSSKPLSTAEREARELQRLAEKRKRAIGPGIDKGGARLANEKRRMGFVDDDDSERIVDPDE